jgi:hypothetical protein
MRVPREKKITGFHESSRSPGSCLIADHCWINFTHRMLELRLINAHITVALMPGAIKIGFNGSTEEYCSDTWTLLCMQGVANAHALIQLRPRSYHVQHSEPYDSNSKAHKLSKTALFKCVWHWRSQ